MRLLADVGRAQRIIRRNAQLAADVVKDLGSDVIEALPPLAENALAIGHVSDGTLHQVELHVT